MCGQRVRPPVSPAAYHFMKSAAVKRSPPDVGDLRLVNPASVVVLGVDPSMTATGYGVIRGRDVIAYGSIRTIPKDPEPHRMAVIFAGLLDIIREHSVAHVAVEQFEHFYFRGDQDRRLSARDDLLLAAGVVPNEGAGARSGRHNPKGPKARDMFLLKAAQSASQLAAFSAGCALFLYPVKEWKSSMIGANAGKEKALETVGRLCRIETRDDNAAEAILIAHHHLLQGRLTPERGYVPDATILARICASIAP
jgi:Holliday junction resolvasome RuvABC endonuclease subunit